MSGNKRKGYETRESGVKVVPDIRRIKDKARFPLKLRITYKGRRCYYGVGHDATIAEWDIINGADTQLKLRIGLKWSLIIIS